MSNQPTPRSVLRGLCVDDQSADLIADQIENLQRENAALEATLSMVYDANQRGIRAWQQAHPDKSMVWPDQTKLVEWLVNENAALRELLRSERREVWSAKQVEIPELLRENAALRELLNESYQFFRFGHTALFPWGEFLDRWCKRAEKLGFKKEAQPCQCTNGIIRTVGRDNDEVIEDCPNCSDSKEAKP